MPPVPVKAGQAYLVDPDSGDTIVVPESQAQQALSEGFVPATGAQALGEEQRRYYEQPGQYAAAGAAGIGRGVTLGLSDLALSQDPATRKRLLELKAAHPVTSGVGEVAGALVGLKGGGPARALVRGGRALGAKTAARTGSEVAGAAAREATVGAGFGAGGGLSQAALTDMDTADATKAVVRGLALGAAAGGGLGAAGAVGRKAAAKAGELVQKFQRARKDLDAAKASAGLRQQLDDLSTAKEAAGGPSPKQRTLTDRVMLAAAERLENAQTGLAETLFSKAIGAGVGSALGGFGGGAVGYVLTPKAVDLARKVVLEPLMRKGAGNAAGQMLERAAGATGRQLQKLETERISRLAVAKMAPGELAMLDDADMRALAAEIPRMDGTSIGTTLAMQFPVVTPEPLTVAAVGGVRTALDYLQEANPNPPPERIPTGAPTEASQTAQEQYMRQVAAVVQPESVIDSFQQRRLVPAQVEAMEAVYPDALQELRQIIAAEVDRVRTSGGKYDRLEASQIALLLGEEPPRMWDQQRVAQLQGLFREKEPPGPKPRSRNMDGLATSQATQAQMQGLKSNV